MFDVMAQPLLPAQMCCVCRLLPSTTSACGRCLRRIRRVTLWCASPLSLCSFCHLSVCRCSCHMTHDTIRVKESKPVFPIHHACRVCAQVDFKFSVIYHTGWTGVSAEAKDALKRDKYGRTGTGACRFVPLSHETYGRAGPPAFALLHELAEFAASTGAVSKKIFMENAMRDLSTTLCRGIARQVLASAPLRARLDGRPVLPGRPVPTDGLA